MHDQFAPTDRSVQLGFEFDAVIDAVLHRLVEDQEAAAPRLLGLVHGDVGRAKHLGPGAPCSARRRAARNVHREAPAASLHGRAQILEETPDGGLQALRLDVADQHGEFVAPHASYDISAARRLEKLLGEPCQQLVASIMAVAVVHVLEVVQVQVEHCCLAVGVGQSIVQEVEEVATAVQSGQPVEADLVQQRGLGGLASRDVL